MATVAAVTAMVADFAGAAEAHDGRGDGADSIGQDQISIQLFNFLVPIIGGFPPPSPPLTTAQTQANIRSIRHAAPIGYRQFENIGGNVGVDRRRIPQGVP